MRALLVWLSWTTCLLLANFFDSSSDNLFGALRSTVNVMNLASF